MLVHRVNHELTHAWRLLGEARFKQVLHRIHALRVLFIT